MKRCVFPILVAMLVLVSSLPAGCVGDKPSLSEKDVVEMAYNYCVSRYEQLQGFDAYIEVIQFEWYFTSYLYAIREESLSDTEFELGERITLELKSQTDIGRPFVYLGMLKKMATYDGNGLWSVALPLGIWEVNELTREVIPSNESARSFIESTTLKTYYNDKAFYSIDYNPSWVVDDTSKGFVKIMPANHNNEYIFIAAGAMTTYRELSSYVQEVLGELQDNYYEFQLLELTDTTIKFKFSLDEGGLEWIAKHHFFQQGSMILEIICGASLGLGQRTSDVESMLNDPYKTFRLTLP